MLFKYKNFIDLDVPENCLVEENDEILSLYTPHGNGAMTISFCNIVKLDGTLEEHISIMGKNFISQNMIKLQSPFILQKKECSQLLLWGNGNTIDDWYIKLWLIAKFPKVVVVTYQSSCKTQEINCFENIVQSIRILG